MQRLAYVCASCRRSGTARLIRIQPTRRSIYVATKDLSTIFSTSSPKKRLPNTLWRDTDVLVSKKPAPKPKPKPKPKERQGGRLKSFLKIKKPKRWEGAGEFYQTSNDGGSFELRELTTKLAKDRGRVGEVYRDFEEFLSTYGRKISTRVMLLKQGFPGALVGAIIEYRNRLEDLPSLSEVLRTLLTNGLNDDKLWAEVMFEYIRCESYDDAIELWHDRLDCQKDDPFALIDGKADEDVESTDFVEQAAKLAASMTSSKEATAEVASYESHCYPTVAALTAFLYSRKVLMMPTELSDVLRFITPNGGDITSLLPPTFGIGAILREYNIKTEIIESTLASLQEFRPYSNDNSKEYTSFFDNVFLAASNGDSEAVHRYYHQSKNEIDPSQRGRIYYVSFINAFLRCGHVRYGTLLWRDMIQAGITPTVKAWTAWLDGCAKARDLKLFMAGWNWMLEQGFTPDSICWTIRMQLLFFVNDPDAAKLCLQHMVDNKIPVTTNTVNIAVERLNALRMYQDAFDLIKWAHNFNIELDTVTFNLIVDSHAKLGDFNGVVMTLEEMATRGIRPDIITYGIILRGMYDRTGTVPDIAIFKAILAEIKSQGIQPNIQFYNTVIYALLDKWDDVDGALQVLALMPNDAWRGSSVTASIFIGYYGRKKDIPAIEALWENMRLNTIAPDDVVYNETVSAYALAQETEKMLEYFETMCRLQRKILISTYNKVLWCLVGEHDYATAWEVLAIMKSRGFDVASVKGISEVVGKLKQAAIDARQSAAAQEFRTIS
ncbi:hypothetical protein TWF694_008739 [Orbilia ellipsospora]|uniref:Pentatricopeptide repeat protein n=1 Tax=Orbilia ellipsospora TaxID=2528407 RepID=A0AAV9XCU3_9PEZI